VYADQVPLDQLKGTAVLVGGPGWDEVPLPGDVRRVDTLTGAVETILNRI
jgi:hypothetical protein